MSESIQSKSSYWSSMLRDPKPPFDEAMRFTIPEIAELERTPNTPSTPLGLIKLSPDLLPDSFNLIRNNFPNHSFDGHYAPASTRDLKQQLSEIALNDARSRIKNPPENYGRAVTQGSFVSFGLYTENELIPHRVRAGRLEYVTSYTCDSGGQRVDLQTLVSVPPNDECIREEYIQVPDGYIVVMGSMTTHSAPEARVGQTTQDYRLVARMIVDHSMLRW